MASSNHIRYAPEELLTIGHHYESSCGFVPTLFFAHRVNWHEILAKPVMGCWLAARERETTYNLQGYIEKRNDWVVILELPEGDNVTIELKQADSHGNTITVCQRGEPIRIVEKDLDGFDLLEGYACSFRNEANTNTKAKDWLDQMEKSGVTRYKLEQGRGRRYWIDAVLRQFCGFYKGELPSLDETEMVHVWESGHEIEVPRSVHSIVAGSFLPTKWPRCSHLNQKRPYLFPLLESGIQTLPDSTEDLASSLPNPSLGPWRFQGTKFDIQSWFKKDGQKSQSTSPESSMPSENQPRPEHHMKDWRTRQEGYTPSSYTFVEHY
ncbi:hypothetical protein F4811DRAFT_569268 [Daldinia bambusicola]|nr:hypothetical protein F4811DRAFT_569268 [Daldinia bambusicola]